MQPVLENILRKLMIGWMRLGDFTLRYAQRALIQLQRFWGWYNRIQWPNIPLSPIQWVLGFYVLFALLFLWATPIFEASDELWHFGMVETIAETGALPVQDVNNPDTIYRQEGSQPPLYYGLAALLVSPFDLSDADQYRIPNPHAMAGIPGSWGNKNLVLHPVEGVPLSGTPLAVYALRVVSIAMGAVTVWTVYQCGKIVAPQRRAAAIVAASLTAFNPMFLFISASVNNDNLVIMLNSLVIWQGLLTLRNGFDTRRSLLLSVLLALATLSKLSALVLVPVLALGALWIARRDKNWRGLLILGSAMLFVWLAIAGWWYWRNITLYGELFGTQTMALVAGPRTDAFTPLTLLAEFEGFRLSYWGVFGAFNIQTTSLFYALADLMVFAAIFGVLFLIAQLVAVRDFSFARHELTLLLFLAGVLLIGMIAFFNWTAQTYATQGRLLFPYIAAISPLLAAGLVELLWWMLFLLTPPERSFLRAGEAVPESLLQMAARWGIRLGAFFALVIPLATIAPQYAAPAPIAESAIPADARTVYARYDDVELVAYELTDRRYLPGEPVRLTLYWRVLESSEQDLSIGITLIDPYGNALSGIDTYPGAGTLRTSQWQEGAVYADTYEIRLPRVMSGRHPFYVTIYWYDADPQNRLDITDRDGAEITSVRLDGGAVVSSTYLLNTDMMISLDEVDPIERDFETVARVRGFAFNRQTFSLYVHWQSLGQHETSYKTFAHIYDEAGNLVAQDDLLPELPTRYWYFGDEFILMYTPDAAENLPPGQYSVEVGWYDESDPETRLMIGMGENLRSTYPVFEFEVDAAGELILPDHVIAAEVTELAPEESAVPDATPTGAVPESTATEESE